MIKDIDEAINTEPDFLNSKVHVQIPLQAVTGEDQCAKINADISEDLGLQSQILRKVDGKVVTQISRMQPTDIKFEMGRVDISKDRKAIRGGPRSNGKRKNNTKVLNGPTNRNLKTT
nr:hypothetical protein CFP56_52681 [Quercus suber]